MEVRDSDGIRGSSCWVETGLLSGKKEAGAKKSLRSLTN